MAKAMFSFPTKAHDTKPNMVWVEDDHGPYTLTDSVLVISRIEFWKDIEAIFLFALLQKSDCDAALE